MPYSKSVSGETHWRCQYCDANTRLGILTCSGCGYSYGRPSPRKSTESTDIGRVIERVSTDQLRQGDVLIDYGMRLVIDRPIEIYSGQHGETVYRSDALIANWAELAEQAAAEPAGTAGFIVRMSRDDQRWTVQGNHLALWSREIGAPVDR